MGRLDKRVAFGQILVSRRDEECTPDIVMVGGFGNTGIVFTEEGVVIVDNTPLTVSHVIEVIRARTDKPIHAIILTHGQADHAFATAALLEDAAKRGHPRPRVIAQEALPLRFDRYKKLGRQNRFINGIQGGRTFAKPQPGDTFLPANAVYPDITYRESMQFRLGGLTFELYRYIGETDDGTWVWIPERKVAIVGDLLENAAPNIGNPFKVQRYEVEWAEALETIASKHPDFIIPGHGFLLRGAQAEEVCLTTAKYLRYLHEEVVRLLNDGCWIEEILERVKIPPDLEKPWLMPIYGCPTYIIHGIHRRYAGWFNGNPSELFPARRADIAGEVTRISGAEALLARARALQQAGNVQLALHLVDFVINGAADATRRKEALLLKAALLDAKAEVEVNTIAKNIFLVGAEAAEQEANSL